MNNRNKIRSWLLQATMMIVLLGTVTGMSANDKFFIPDFSIKAGETKELAIQFESDNVNSSDSSMLNYVALQFDLYLPEGLTVVQKKGKYNFTFNADRCDDHTFSSALQTDGAIRVLAASLSNANFWETSGDFIYFSVTADADFSGNQEIALKNIMFSTTTGRTNLTDSKTNVTTSSAEPSNDNFYIPNFSIKAGETKELAIQFESDNVNSSDPSMLNYVALQFDLYLPEGLTVVQKKGKYNFTFNADRCDDHTFSSALQTDGAIRVLAASLSNANFWETSGDFIYFSVTADAGFSGNQEIALKNIMFSTTTGRTSVEDAITEVNGLPSNIEVNGITLDKNAIELTEGETTTLTATVTPSDATDKTVAWTTSDESIATVDNGVVTAVSEGTATITAKAGNYTATCTITVNRKVIEVTGITLDKDLVTLFEGETITLSATISPINATDRKITWTSSNKDVAYVNIRGSITAVSAGTTIITAQAGNYTATCKVTVNKKVISVTGITLDKSTATITEGENITLTATVSPENATDKTVTWTSSNTSVATVNNGVVTAISVGIATITAKAGNYTATCIVTVKSDGAIISSGEYYLYNTQTQSFLTRGEYWGTCACVDKYGIPFYWDSDEGSIKFLDSNQYLYEADPTYIYTDSENSTGFQFIEKDGGYCLESLKTLTYLTLAEGSHGLKTLTTTSDINEATVWVLKSKTEHDAIVTGYTIENYEHVIATAGINSTSDKFVGYLSTCIATDMTSYIGTAQFTGNVGNWIYNEVRAQDAQPAYGTDFCELWQATGSYTQTINGLPKGIYKVTMQGFERSGGYIQCNALGEKGYEITTATLKANGEEINLKSWYSEKSGTNYPNRTYEAVAAFNEGRYMNELYTYVGNDGKLTLTVNKPSHVSDNWMLFNNFTLTYYEKPVEVTSVMLDRYSTELTVGETATLTAYVYPEDATDKAVIWTSANTAVATVANGVVRAVSAGTTTITAKAGEHTATCTIRVNKKVVNVTGIILDKVSAELTEGETVTLTATVSPDNATDKTVTWTSSDETVATVKDGVVTAIAAGKATITAKAGNYTGTCGVTVNAKIIHATNISLDKVSAELTEGETVTLTATVSPDNATDKTVTWTSSDETVATVKNGVVTAIVAGKATITAKTGNYTATCSVTVKAKEIAISSIVLDKNEIEVTDEDDFMLTATIYPENATNEDVVWEIADEEIVINLYQNIFIAIKEGVTTITAKAGDKTATCTVTVKKADGIENSEAEDNTWPADIYDITGRMLKKNATSTDDLEKGIYLIKGKKVIIK